MAPERRIPGANSEEKLALVAGRKRYNAARARVMRARRAKLAGLVMRGIVRPKQHSLTMELLGVSSSTALRDMAAVLAMLAEKQTCPTCGRAYPEHITEGGDLAIESA